MCGHNDHQFTSISWKLFVHNLNICVNTSLKYLSNSFHRFWEIKEERWLWISLNHPVDAFLQHCCILYALFFIEMCHSREFNCLYLLYICSVPIWITVDIQSCSIFNCTHKHYHRLHAAYRSNNTTHDRNCLQKNRNTQKAICYDIIKI